MISHIRYFYGSSFYLVCGVGILELVARFKDFIPTRDSNLIELGIFEEFCKKKYNKENFIYKIISYIANGLKNSKDAFSVVYHHLENDKNYLYEIELDFREILLSILAPSDIELKSLIESGNNPISQMPAILEKMSKLFGISIVFLNLDSYFSTFNPPDFKNCPKFFLIYTNGDYSIGYNEGMMKYLQNQEITSNIIEDLTENRKISEKLNKMQHAVEVLLKFITEKQIYDKNVSNVIKSLERDIGGSLIKDYLNLSSNEDMVMCIRCKSNYNYSEFIKQRCSIGCYVCVNCLIENLDICPNCKESHNESIKAEIRRRAAARDLRS